MSAINFCMSKYRHFLLAAIFLIVSLIVPVILSLPASAATPSSSFTANDVTAVWVNRITIEVTIKGQKYLFVDGGGLNDDFDYKFQIQESNCYGEIRGVPSGYLTAESAAAELEFDIDYLPVDGECVDQDNNFRKAVGSPGNAMIAFQWVSKDKIETVDGASGWTFTDDTSPESPDLVFFRSGETECRDKLIVSSDRSSAVFYELDRNGLGGDAPAAANAAGCKIDPNPARTAETSNPRIGIADPLGNMEQANSDTGEFSNGAGSASSATTCESEGGIFSWVLCGALEMASGAFEQVDGWINEQLEFSSAYYEHEDVKTAWANIRNIAYIILIPVMLVMVIGTALGFSFVDAYTVKRALPRLFVAIMFMALSYNIMIVMIEAVNIIGNGIGGLIAAPFGGSEALTLQGIFNPGNMDSFLVLGFGSIVLAGLAAGFVLGAVTLGIMVSYLFVAVLAIFTIFFLLVFRQMILIGLMITAPLAIIAWIFPGNDKMWKIWWGSFSKLLLLYPIIVGALITGRAFASIVPPADGGGVEGLITILIKLTAYIGPFFLIPAVFRYAGGAFANLAGIVNNRSKGLFDRQRKFRSHQSKQGWDRRGKRMVTQTRADWQNRLQAQASRGGLRGRAASLGSRAVGGYNIQAQDSEMRERVGKEMNAQIATGRDDEIRGLTVNKTQALRGAEGEDWRRNEDGTRQFRTLGGGWVNEAAVDEGHRRWGRDTYAQQTALSYEMRKAMETGQVERISAGYGALSEGSRSEGGWGMTRNQAEGAMIGAGFENQNQHLEFKHMRRQDDGSYALNYDAFAREMYEKKNSYAVSSMSGNTINRLTEAYESAGRTLEADPANEAALETQRRVRAVAETFVQRGMAGGQQIGADGETPRYAPPETTGAAGTGGTSSQVYASGSGSVNEKVANLARVTGVLDAAPNEPFRRADAGSDQKGQEPPSPPGTIILPGDPRYRG